MKIIFGRLVNWFESYTKTDIKYVTKSSFWLGIGQVVSAGNAFILSLIVARYLPAEVYGAYKFVASISVIIASFSLTGLATSIVQKVAQGNEASLRNGFRKNLKWSLLTIILSFGICIYYWQRELYELSIAFAIAGIVIPHTNAGSLYGAYLAGKKHFKEETILWCIGSLLTTVLLIYSTIFHGSLISMILAYSFGTLTISMFGYLYVVRKYKLPKSKYEKDSHDLHLSIINILSVIAFHIDKLLIFHFLGAVQLAIYTFAIAIPDQLRALLKSGARVALPKFAERDFGTIKKTLNIRLLRFSVMLVGVSLVYIAIAPYVYKYLFPAYVSSIPYSQVLSFSIFTVLGSVTISALQAHRKTQSLYTYAISTSIIQIITTAILIPIFGLWGAVWSTLINRTIAIIIPSILISRSINSQNNS